MTFNDQQTSIQSWLSDFVTRHQGVSGTVHLRSEGSLLILAASHNIPGPVLAMIQSIPEGKGMAGLAWQRNEPVATCNLKTDSSGDVRPGAKAVNAQAAVALPIHQLGQVVGVVGIAFAIEQDLSSSELLVLNTEAETVLLL
jgi:L-methionine (R)-S-oxide reductase